MIQNFLRLPGWGKAVILAALILLALWLGVTFSNRLLPYQPQAGRDTSDWGTFDPQTALRLRTALDASLERQGIPGLQAAVQSADGKTWYGTSGTLDLQRRIPLERDHILRIGSVTKTFVAVVVLQLVQEGRLGLDDSLARWYPDFPNAAEITIRDLLSHRSGIYNFLQDPRVLASMLLPHYSWQPQAIIEIAAQADPAYLPGQTYYYSNTNYVLLGLIAEQVTGEDAATLIRTRISEPLGLRNTCLVPDEAPPATLIRGYDRDLIPFPGFFRDNPDNTTIATAAFTSGAMVSTAEDLRIFYDGLFSGRLLAPEMLAEMTTFYPASDPGTPQLTGYGLGLFRLEIDGEEVWASLGEYIGFMTMVSYSPGRHDIVALVGNLSIFDYIDVWKGLAEAAR